MFIKTVAITGANGGIGKAIAMMFAIAKEGYELVLTYERDIEGMEVTKNELISLGASSVKIYRLNLKDDSSIKHFVNSATKDVGFFDILINNAGLCVKKKFSEQNFIEIDNQIKVNFEGAVKLLHECLPFIKSTVINIGAKSLFEHSLNMAIFNATKSALREFTKSLLKEHEGLKFYTINPDLVATKSTQYEGREPIEVALVVKKIVFGEIVLENGSDINVWEYI
ncbi:MAG: SDR family oxidoreductase [Campylobacterales bacterium]|nr:SDR family oxidoreductase [Campylobacterales bacterium]